MRGARRRIFLRLHFFSTSSRKRHCRCPVARHPHLCKPRYACKSFSQVQEQLSWCLSLSLGPSKRQQSRHSTSHSAGVPTSKHRSGCFETRFLGRSAAARCAYIVRLSASFVPTLAFQPHALRQHAQVRRAPSLTPSLTWCDATSRSQPWSRARIIEQGRNYGGIVQVFVKGNNSKAISRRSESAGNDKLVHVA